MLETNLTCNISASGIFPKILGDTIYILAFARDPRPLPLCHIGGSAIKAQHSGVSRQAVSGPSVSVRWGLAWSLCDQSDLGRDRRDLLSWQEESTFIRGSDMSEHHVAGAQK